MEEELRKLREDVAWQRDLARQRDQELQALRARESKTAVEIKGFFSSKNRKTFFTFLTKVRVKK